MPELPPKLTSEEILDVVLDKVTIDMSIASDLAEPVVISDVNAHPSETSSAETAQVSSTPDAHSEKSFDYKPNITSGGSDDVPLSLPTVQDEKVKTETEETSRTEVDTKKIQGEEMLVLASSMVKQVTECIAKINQLFEKREVVVESPVLAFSRFYIGQAYKQMVKGCGNGRSQYGLTWAGALEPGDSWLNALLRAYIREQESSDRWKELKLTYDYKMHRIAQKRKKAEEKRKKAIEANPGISTNSYQYFQMTRGVAVSDATVIDIEDQYTKNMDAAKLKSPQLFDIVTTDELLKWAKHVRYTPSMHSFETVETTETAVRNLGGWKHFETFGPMWLRQFYLQIGQVQALTFPLSANPTSLQDATSNGTLKAAPLSFSLETLFTLPPVPSTPLKKRSHKKSLKLAEHQAAWKSFLTRSIHVQDQRYWDFVWQSINENLMHLHDVMDFELDGGEDGIRRWMDLVDQSELLTKGAYKDFGAERSMPSYNDLSDHDKKKLHPKLVRIREVAIVVNACLKPTLYSTLFKIDNELRGVYQQVSSILVSNTKSNSPFSWFSRSKASLNDSTASLCASKTHRRTVSLDLLRRAKTTSDEVADDASTTTPNTLDRSTASVPMAEDLSENIQAKLVELQRRQVIDICSRGVLPDIELVKKAFAISQAVVEYYLKEELLAKYQAVY